jgi:hypothetical protein
VPRDAGSTAATRAGKRAYRARHTTGVIAEIRPQRRRGWREATVYKCPTCSERYLGENRCDECNTFCKSLGLGIACAECDTTILLNDILDELGLPVRLAPRR